MKKNPRKPILVTIIQAHPVTATLVENKYKVIGAMLKRLYPELQKFSQDHLADIVFNAVHGDRDWRLLTEDKDKKKKKELAKKFASEYSSVGYRAREPWYNK